jgi:hypothetical protein
MGRRTQPHMRRNLTVLLMVVLVLSLSAPGAIAKKRKKPPAPVPVDLTYYVVWNADHCSLSTTMVSTPDEACADPGAGLLAPAIGAGPWSMEALDGLPLTIDVSKTIRASIAVESYYAVGVGPDVMGIGEAQVEVRLVGTSGGQEVVIGELTTDPYMVTPASAEYQVDFEIQPPPEAAGKVFDSLTLSLESTGTHLFHGVFTTEGTSTLTIGSFATP